MAGDQEPEPQQPDFDKSSTIPRNSDISQSYRRMFQTKRPASTAGLPSPQTPYPGQGPYPTASYPQTPVHTGAYPSTPTGPYPTTPTGTDSLSSTLWQWNTTWWFIICFFCWNTLYCVIAGCSSQGYFSGSTSHNAYGSYSTGHGPVIVTPGVATIRRTPSSKPTARRSASVGGTGPIPIRTPMVPVKIPTVPDTAGAFNGSRNSEVLVGAGGKSPDSPTYAGGEDVDMLPMMSWSGQATTNPPTVLPIYQSESGPQQGGGGDEEETGDFGGGNMLVAIRKGVKLKRTLTNDRSAPRIAWWHRHFV